MASSSSNTQQEKFVPSDEFVLQKHVAFFDRNHDGIIYPWETFQGFRAIGRGIVMSTLAAFFINISLSGKTRPGKFPNLLFPIEIINVHRAKIGGDSGAYDSEGRDVYKACTHIYLDALTGKEVRQLLRAKRAGNFLNEWVVAFVEWIVLFCVAKDENGLLQKDTFRAVYDGSLFERLEKEHFSAKKKD